MLSPAPSRDRLALRVQLQMDASAGTHGKGHPEVCKGVQGTLKTKNCFLQRKGQRRVRREESSVV
jgi:hypothetical protein